MADQVVTLYPGDSLTVSVPGTQPPETADAQAAPEGQPDPGTTPASDTAPDGTPTDPAAEPDGTPDQGGVTETDNAPSGVGAG